MDNKEFIETIKNLWESKIILTEQERDNLVYSAKTEEEKYFYITICEKLMQKKQMEIVKNEKF